MKNKKENEFEYNKIQLDYGVYAKVIFICGIIFSVVFLGIRLLMPGNDSKSMWIGIIAFDILFFAIALVISNWSLEIDEEKIESHSFSGKKHLVYLNELKFYSVAHDGKLVVFGDDKEIVIDSELKRAEVLSYLNARGIRENNFRRNDSFEVSASKTIKVFGLVLVFFSFLLFLLSLFTTYAVAYVVFPPIFIASILVCMKRFKDKYIFRKNEVEVHSLGKKGVIYPYTDISCVEIKDFDNKKWMRFMKDEKVLFKINMNYDGMNELNELVKRRHWVKNLH